jgi:hypothetical protein
MVTDQLEEFGAAAGQSLTQGRSKHSRCTGKQDFWWIRSDIDRVDFRLPLVNTIRVTIK